MKKTALFLVITALLFSFTACGQQAPEQPVSTPEQIDTPAATSETPETTPESVTEPVSEETELPQMSDALAGVSLVDAQSMGIITTDYSGMPTKLSVANAGTLTDALYNCFVAIGINYSSVEYLKSDPTTAEFSEYVYDILSQTDLPAESAVSGGADFFLRETGIIYSDIKSAADDRITVDEAMLMLARAAVYASDANSAGSKGLVWELSDEDTTVYLLGSIHVDDAAVYPFSAQLSDIIASSDAIAFEADFGDTQGLAYLQANSVYPEGDFLSNHISEETMTELMEIYSVFGITDQSVLEQFRPWALASEIMNLALYSENGQITSVPMVMDMYVYYKALELGTTVLQIEGWEFQTDMMNSLDDDSLEEYLKSSINAYNGVETEEESELQMLAEMLAAWRNRDVEEFSNVYVKDEYEDSISIALFSERDESMTNYILELLGEKTGQYLITVGAGHMVGESGIVARLAAEGYTVNVLSD